MCVLSISCGSSPRVGAEMHEQMPCQSLIDMVPFDLCEYPWAQYSVWLNLPYPPRKLPFFSLLLAAMYGLLSLTDFTFFGELWPATVAQVT